MALEKESDVLKRLQEEAKKKAEAKSSLETAMNAHSLQQKKRTVASAGGDYSAAKIEGVNPSQAQAVTQTTSSTQGNMNKGAAAAGLAQQMGVAPSDGMAGGAISGAAAGSAFGPYGAAVGAVAGGIMGAAASSAKKKAHNAQVEAQKEQQIGENERRKGEQMSSAINQMGQRMRIR